MSKKNAKQKLQGDTRRCLALLGYPEYANKSSLDIVSFLETLYPECCTSDEMSKAEKVKYSFSNFLEIVSKKNDDFKITLPKSRKKENKKIAQYDNALTILRKLGYVGEKEQKTEKDLYLIIKQIHPELTVFSGAAYYMKKTFKTFIELYSNPNLSEDDKQKILQKVNEARERKRNKVKRKNGFVSDGTKSYRQIREDFYRSAEWQSTRYIILKEQGGKCQLCGRSRKDGVVLHVDHIIPLSKDWTKRLDKNNLQVLCEDCNMGKSNTDSIDWR